VTVELRVAETTAYFTVTGEAPMDSYLGPDATMDPYEAEAVIIGGALSVIHVYGWQISTATGRVTRRIAKVDFTRLDLGLDEPTAEDLENRDEDWEPTVVPDWVATLAAAVDLARKL
jgi:hypothetical protein